MKTRALFLILIAFSSVQLLNAQTEKGNIRIGGSFWYTNNNTESPGSSSKGHFYYLNPGCSYFVKDGFALGFDMAIGRSRTFRTSDYLTNEETYQQMSSLDESDYGFGLIAQNYVKLAGNLSAMVHSRLSYVTGRSNSETTISDPNYSGSMPNPWIRETSSKSLSFAMNPGLIYFVNPRIGIHTAFGGFSFTKNTSIDESRETDNQSSWTSFSFNVNPSTLRLGASYFF